MAIYKRGGVYWYEFVFGGRRVRRSTKQKNRRVAREIEAAYKTKLAKGEVGIDEPKPVPLFQAAMNDFLTFSEHEHAAHPNTHNRYKVSSKPLKRYFRDARIDSISPEDVEKYKQHRARTKSPATNRFLRPATINRELACLKILFNRAIKDDVISKNPVSRVKFLAENNEQMRVLSMEEQQTYLLAASQPLQDIARLMVETGMRPEEVCRIRRDDVYLERGYLFNPHGKTKAAKRKVPLNESAAAVLSSRLTSIDGQHLFPGRGVGDRPIIKVNNAHVNAVKRSKVTKFRLYDLRHTWATRAAMAGVDLVTLAAMLGHSRIQMVLRYAHPTEEHQFQAMRKLEAYVAAR
ncbi:MAG: tyrosine-type recombinase/integrase [Acidobacteriota bacterium]|nr:tyrosine-type recombinase/integrase [Acidobacteriota bacterium]